ncbi:MAG: hypothetical protein AB7G21_08225 [Dehalococcoidia bacterium]
MPPRSRSTLLVLALALVALLAGACRTEQTGGSSFVKRTKVEAGEPRAFLLGFSDTPWALTDLATRQTYDLAAHYGEVILVQRSPNWADFLPGASPSEATRHELTAVRDAARSRDLRVAIVLDPFDPTARDRLQRLPATHAGKDLANPELRAALVQESVFIAKNLRPAYLVLGNEVNATFERNPATYLAFLAAYREAYDAVKAAAPETQVLPSFQYEELLGVIPDLPPHPPRWQLLKDFEGKMDLAGITTYPSFAFNVARKVPPTYYSALREHTALPIAFVSVGFASGPGRDNLNSSTPAEQRRFLQRLFEDADLLGSPLVVWFAERDLSFATAPPYDLLASLGLRDIGDRPKEAWPVWEAATNRPYDPAAAEELRAKRAAEAAAQPTATAGTGGNGATGASGPSGATGAGTPAR